MATVDMHYFRAALHCAERQGLDGARLLRQVGVDRKRLSEARGRVHGDQMSQLVQQVWAGSGDEFMGCTAVPCKRGVFGLMARYGLHYPTLGALLERGVEFYNLVTDQLSMSLQQRGQQLQLEVQFRHPQQDPERFFHEFWLVIWHRFSSWVIGQQIPLQAVHFDYPRPTHHRELRQLFPCPHRFRQPALKLLFDRRYLNQPVVRTQSELEQFLLSSPADMITIPGEVRSYRDRIRALLLQQGEGVLHCPTIDQLASRFHISAQTLRRRLQSEGSRYPQIKNEVRRDLALDKLHRQGLAVSDVAAQLGFSEPRSFSRAFLCWTGETPSAYQRRLRGNRG